MSEMEELPCNCPTCSRRTVQEFSELDLESQEMLLARHNLSICLSELRRIREAVRTGRLWELLETRSRVNPSLGRCFDRLAEYSEFIMKYDPVVKTHGVYHYPGPGSDRPELTRFRKRLFSMRSHWNKSKTIVLLPAGWRRPFHQDPAVEDAVRKLRDFPSVSIVFYSLPFGPVPLELDEAYPIPHTDVYDPKIPEEYARAASQVAEYVRASNPDTVFLVLGTTPLGEHVLANLKKTSPLGTELAVDGLGNVLGKLLVSQREAVK
jgi:7-cyano-7-deazaguanine tRNA-ribosyltransferase